ncbi:MAG: PRC-barrel domain-containing protein [Candidatus Methanofastidiosa archaeon]|jgi:sporulation protein YlmC with PRC-barrel domain|nr:PRC-barrel domain-containing protein [Candidatus Methanofastidiosa archaeon]MDD4280957.1 PRC-barrel domain-containing protein [Candidatus Methanofastidiosa archaeon]
MGKIVASRLRDRMIVTEQGHEIGILFDIVVDEATGKLTALIAEPANETIKNILVTDKDGMCLIPFSAVHALKDFVVIDAKRLPRKTQKVGMFAKEE